MTYLKRHYDKPDLWSNVKANNLLPVVTFIVGLMSTIYIFQAKIDRTIDRVTYLEAQFGDYRTIEYKNAIDLSSIKARLGLPSDQVLGIATPPATLQITPKGK